MPSAGSGTVDGTGAVIFEGQCTSFFVAVDEASAVAAEVNVLGLHEADEWFVIPAGDSQVFRYEHGGISLVTARGASGTATIRYGVVAKTQQ